MADEPESPLLHQRARPLHWTALAASLLALGILGLALVKPLGSDVRAPLMLADVFLTLFFGFEFFTRTGWRHRRLAYVASRWFDFLAMIPVLAFWPEPLPLARWAVWVLFGCRVARAIDRTLGDGFVQRHLGALLEAFEEEISDRVIEKMMVRWEAELQNANFASAAAEALRKNRNAVLQRIYAEQLQEGTMARIAQITGLQGAIEKKEARLFDAVIEMIGSRETDDAIRDVIHTSMRRVREGLGQKTWRTRIGLRRAGRA